MILFFWALSFAAGAGFAFAVRVADTSFLRAGPSSAGFMLIGLLIVTLIYQIRMNLSSPRPAHATFVFAPPNPSILGDVIAFFFATFLIT